MKSMGTIGLLLRQDPKTRAIVLDEVISDDRELSIVEKAIEQGLSISQKLIEHRAAQAREEDEFGDYVEDILSQPFVSPDVKKHGLLWLKSKMRIEHYQRKELQASRVIADYAMKLFEENPAKTDLILKGPHSRVRVKIFVLAAEVQTPALAG